MKQTARFLTKLSRAAPTLWDRPSRSHTCIVYTPCDCSHRPSRSSHYTSDTPTIHATNIFSGFIHTDI